MIVLPPDIASDIVTHAKEHAPIEACGLLAGANGVVTHAYRLTNCDASPEHFSLDPKEQFAAAREMRAAGLELLAVYHSHPESPARMSEEDLRLALAPGMLYVIVSLLNTKPEIKSFTIRDGVPLEEPVDIRESIE
jgi:[CysO sulfur-carrier protein]-S-L-cysteine hydrolase